MVLLILAHYLKTKETCINKFIVFMYRYLDGVSKFGRDFEMDEGNITI